MAESYKGKTVLVVDDQESFLDAVAFEFEIIGLKPIKARHGLDGLEKFKTNKVDLVISDIRMPVCDGGGFLDGLRKISPRTPPFIFMTGFADLKPAEAYDRGADAFIGKPLKSNELRDLVRVMLCQEDEKWSTPTGNSDMYFKAAFNLAGNSHFQIGKSGFFISYAVAADLQGMDKDSRIDFDFSLDASPMKSFKGIGRILWVREDDEGDALAGCGVLVESLDPACRLDALAFFAAYDGIKTVPKGIKV